MIGLTELYTYLLSLSSMQLALFYQYVFLLPGGSAVVPFNRFGQEDAVGQRPLWPQLKHLSARMKLTSTKRLHPKERLIRRKQLPVDEP